jgi:ferredoxin
VSLESEIYRRPNPHEVDVPRRGDLAEIVRSHCVQESGRIVQVMHDPHLCTSRCTYCGLCIEEFMVEVHCDDPKWQDTPGPWFMPVKWLKRIDPNDPVQYERIRSYKQVIATKEQERLANL